MTVNNIVDLDAYRAASERDDHHPPADDIRAMSYDDLVDWAGDDFERCLAVIEAKDYRPEWIGHQITAYRDLTVSEAEALARMIADAGPFLSRRHRWIMRQIRSGRMTEAALSKQAAGAPVYRTFKHPERCVANDLAKMVAAGVIKIDTGQVYSEVVRSGGAAPASTPRTAGLSRTVTL